MQDFNYLCIIKAKTLMKKILFLLFALAMLPMMINADNYTALWKQADEAREKDLPQTEQDCLQQIIKKAKKEKAYGHLMKAELRWMKAQTAVSADSLAPAVARLAQAEVKARQENPVLAMIYASVLGSIYKHHSDLDDDHEAISADYYSKSLAQPKLLAAQKALDYVPLVVKGEDSRIFYNDLLSMLGYEAGNLELIHDYYDKAGNRQAALITALEILQKSHKSWEQDFKQSAYVASLDSLISRYGDLTECGEAAIARYQMMEQCNVTADERIQFIDEALQKWGTWPRMNELQNARKALTQPMFSARLGDMVSLPEHPRKIELDAVRNVREVTLTISKLKLDATTKLNPNNNDHYAKLKAAVERVMQTESRKYTGMPSHKIEEDSIIIKGLPVGLYMVEMATDNKGIKPSRCLYYVSDLYILSQELPGKTIRYAVVSGTTGQPVAGAHLKLTFPYRYDTKQKTEILTCGQNGEVLYTYTNNTPEDLLAYTANDKYLPSTSIWNAFSFYESRPEDHHVSLYTDRSIYRPGQTVHVAALAFVNKKGISTKAVANKTIRMTLRNANHQVVEEKNVTTDAFGMASADFVLPANGLNGGFFVQSSYGNGYAHFTVDEYKRPTFQIEFPEYKETYQHGDTVVVKGYAKSFAGVPVQGAKVKYNVKRSQAYWWWRYGMDEDANALLSEGETLTDADGSFQIAMPMQLPEWALTEGNRKIARFYQITTWAEVTDQAGESHESQFSLPLGTKPLAFGCEIPDKSLRDDLKSITFTLYNMAGQPVDGQLRWQVDGGEWYKANANQSVDVSKLSLASGQHEIHAICGSDTLKQKFVVFRLDDKRPCIETHDWFYQTASEFPKDGKPVTIQVGSSDADTHILYTIIAGKRILESGVIDQSNAILTRQFTYKEEYGSGLLLTYAWVKEGEMYQHQTHISRPMPDKRLNLKWKTFRDKLTPGQKEEWTLNITYPDGSPAKAQLLAAMYDKSLDKILHHDWNFDPQIYQNLPSTQWNRGYYGSLQLHGNALQRYLEVIALSFNQIDPSLLVMDYWFDGVYALDEMRASVGVRSKPMLARAKAAVNSNVMAEEAYEMADMEAASDDMKAKGATKMAAKETESKGEENTENGAPEQQVRENLNETAFFYPALVTDKDGNIAVKFTLPESLTTWKFIGLGHDTDMNYGLLDGETVAKKDIMIQPNMPRFIRQGDKATITARIFNTGEKSESGVARLLLIDPETGKEIAATSQKVELGAGSTNTVTFTCTPQAEWPTLLIAKCIVDGKSFSDGEQHYLPILPNMEMVINTLPFTQNTAGLMTIDLAKLFPKGKTDNTDIPAHSSKLTVEYTNYPAWLMIQALPTVAARSDKDVISQATAFYANSLGAFILHQNPSIKQTIQLWQQEQGNETSLMSSLQKDQELKTLVLDETPWVMDADHEADQKRQLINFFDENTLQFRLEQNLTHLRNLQNPDGSWSWWPGMKGSRYMTVAVTRMLTRLNVMTDIQESTSKMLAAAMKYLGNEMIEEVKEMRKIEKENKIKDLRPSETAVDVLYIWSLADTELSGKTADARDYLVEHLAKQTHEFTIYGKAVAAVILSHNDKRQKAAEYLESIRQYTVYTEEKGRYFDTRKAYYSWRDYKIPTEVAAIEAIKAVEPNDKQTVEEMQRWLLQSKRTQSWDTPLNSVDAVYAFLNGRTEILETKEPAVITLNGKMLELPKATAGLGYVKTSATGDDMKTLTIKKTSDGSSWGALYAQFMQPVSEIQQSSAGLSVKREILAVTNSSQSSKGKTPTPKSLNVGDKVKVRITITAERDYDFVQVIDKRAACMEPVQQLSGYHWGYYCSPKDHTTNYYFDRLSKGKHVVESEFYVDRPGTYETGTCTVQCAYAPEYTARAAAQTLVVK